MTTQAVVLSTTAIQCREQRLSPGVVPPMGSSGEANVAPLKLLAFRLATLVVLVCW